MQRFESIGIVGNTGRSNTQLEDGGNLIENLKQRLIENNSKNLVFLGDNYRNSNIVVKSK